MLRYEFRAMGCQMLTVIDSDGDDAREALMQVPEWFAEWEASLSRFRADSETNRLNQSDGKPVHVSDILWQVIQVARRAADDSASLVTPTLLDAIKVAGYDRTFEKIGDSTWLSSPSAAKPAPDWRELELDPLAQTVRVPPGIRLDLGGVAKGWAADEAARRLSAIAPALVDAGGDIAVTRPSSVGSGWPIAIADPFNAGADLDLVAIECGGIATSGRDFRRWRHGGRWQHHIVDPRTGAPAETDVLTATVIAPTTTAARAT